jgi:rubredoxin
MATKWWIYCGGKDCDERLEGLSDHGAAARAGWIFATDRWLCPRCQVARGTVPAPRTYQLSYPATIMQIIVRRRVAAS